MAPSPKRALRYNRATYCHQLGRGRGCGGAGPGCGGSPGTGLGFGLNGVAVMASAQALSAPIIKHRPAIGCLRYLIMRA